MRRFYENNKIYQGRSIETKFDAYQIQDYLKKN